MFASASMRMSMRKTSSSSQQSWSDLYDEGTKTAEECVATASSSACTETTSEGGRSASKGSPAICDDDDAEEDRVSLPATECDWPLTPRLHCQDPYTATVEQPHWPSKVQAPVPQTARVAASSHPSTPPTGNSLFRVACLGGVEVRDGPHGNASCTGVVLAVNEIVEVCEELPCADGCIYLRLADGRGWVFDDSALMPHDPSMVRGRWEQSHTDSSSPSPLSQSQRAGSAPAMSAPLLPLLSSTPAERSAAPAASSPQLPLLSSTPAPDWWQAGQARAGQASPTAASAVATTQESPVSWFRVAFLGGINLRTGPSIDAPLTGVTLPQNAVMSVAEEVRAEDGRLFLRICDGYSWAFDDSALIPEDPSVKRSVWVQHQPNVWCLIDADTASESPVAQVMSPTNRNRVRQRLNRRNRKSERSATRNMNSVIL